MSAHKVVPAQMSKLEALSSLLQCKQITGEIPGLELAITHMFQCEIGNKGRAGRAHDLMCTCSCRGGLPGVQLGCRHSERTIILGRVYNWDTRTQNAR